MLSLIEKFKQIGKIREVNRKIQEVSRRIPEEVYQLIETINQKYSDLDLNKDNFERLNAQEKTSELISIINNDNEIKKLHSLSYIGCIIKERGNDTSVGILQRYYSALTLCIGEEGLFIYNSDDAVEKYDVIPVTPENLKKYFGRDVDAEEIKKAIVDYTNRENYINCAADFGKFSK